jgi:hypothetical protein
MNYMLIKMRKKMVSNYKADSDPNTEILCNKNTTEKIVDDGFPKKLDCHFYPDGTSDNLKISEIILIFAIHFIDVSNLSGK